MLAKTSYIANCFYSAARVRRSHRQGRAGCYPVMLMGTTSQQDAAPCTVTVGCFRRLASCYLHVALSFHVSYRLQLMLSAVLCVCVCFALLFVLHFISCCICDGIHADVAETALILYDHCCVFMWDKKLDKLLLRGIAQVELCRDSALIPFSSGYARS